MFRQELLMRLLDGNKLLDHMQRRKDTLYDQITRDFGGGEFGGRVYTHYECKYWKEAIERGEYDAEIEENETDLVVYIIMTLPNEPVDFTFYTSEEAVIKRVDELNSVSESGVYWYMRLSGNFRNVGDVVEC